MTVPVSYLQLAAAYRTDRRVGVFVYCPAFARTSEYASCLFFSPYHCVSLSLCLFLPVPFPCHLTVFCPQAGERGVLYGSVRVLLRTRDWARHSASSVSPGPPRRHHVMSASHILPLAFSPFFFLVYTGQSLPLTQLPLLCSVFLFIVRHLGVGLSVFFLSPSLMWLR